MRRFLTCFLLMFFSFSLVALDANAARFGGGRSFGVQRSHHHLYSNPSKGQAHQKAPPTNMQNKSRFGSILGGMLIGGLLASLFMGHGFGAGLLSWLLVAALIVMALHLKRRFMTASPAGAMGANPFQFSANTPWTSSGASSGTPSSLAFDEHAFIRQAKVNFIRLQAAYDHKNEADLASFLAPDIFAEIKMQLQERGILNNQTEVLELDAVCLDVSTRVGGLLISVEFNGRIKENNESPTEFKEIWHIRKTDAQPFMVVGIQQEVIEVN